MYLFRGHVGELIPGALKSKEGRNNKGTPNGKTHGKLLGHQHEHRKEHRKRYEHKENPSPEQHPKVRQRLPELTLLVADWKLPGKSLTPFKTLIPNNPDQGIYKEWR